MKTIYISGQDGFIGKNLTKYLLSKGYEVYGCDLKNNIDFINQIPKADIVIHCAAWVSVTESEEYPQKYIDNNISSLLKFAQNNKDKKFIFLSTGGALYGSKEFAREEEADIDEITNVYAMTKFVGEWIVKHYCKDYLILRLGNVYGDGEDDRGEANVYTHFRQDDPIILYGEHQKRDFIHVDQVVKAIEKGLNLIGTYNLGNGVEIDITDLAIKFSKERNVKLINKPIRPGEVQKITLDNNRAKKVGLL